MASNLRAPMDGTTSILKNRQRQMMISELRREEGRWEVMIRLAEIRGAPLETAYPDDRRFGFRRLCKKFGIPTPYFLN